MAATGTERAVRTPSVGVLWLWRLAVAALSTAMGLIHGYLWVTGYRDLPLIGPSFLVNWFGGVVLALALLLVPQRMLGWVAAAGAVFTAGSLGALLVSLTVGLFGFTESMAAPLVPTTLAVESVGTVLLGVLAAVLLAGRGADARADTGGGADADR